MKPHLVHRFQLVLLGFDHALQSIALSHHPAQFQVHLRTSSREQQTHTRRASNAVATLLVSSTERRESVINRRITSMVLWVSAGSPENVRFGSPKEATLRMTVTP